MSNDNWINEAFKQAQKDLGKANTIAEKIRGFLDEYTPGILDRWSNMVGREKAMAFAKFMADNDEARDLVETLTECFTIAGYLFAKIESDKNYTL